jgi:hypothetical protein
MTDELTLQIASWINSDVDDTRGFRSLKAKIDFLTEVLYNEYLPTKAGAHGEFRHRLTKWIRSASNEDQKKLMFLLLNHLFFIGQKEMEALYLTAYSRHVAEWLLMKDNIQLDGPQAEEFLKRAFASTLFTGITDSLRLGDFIRMNEIQGHPVRFCWEQGLTNWNPPNFVASMANRKRIVLLEDFVGSGSQMRNAVVAACSLAQRYEVLLCPLVICPDGTRLATQLMTAHANLSFSPVLQLERSCFVEQIATAGEPPLFAELRKLAVDLHLAVVGTTPWAQDHGPYGFGKTGALIVKHDNCPDNTLPMIHHASNTPWNPLFLRTSRVPL